MCVIPATHVALTRARKTLSRAYQVANWHSVGESDELLSEVLSQAFDDPNRNQRYLMQEMEKILALYADIMRSHPDDHIPFSCAPEQVS